MAKALYRIWTLFKVIDMYPLFSVCIVHAFFILNAWLGNHGFVKYASLLQNLMILSLLLPILRRKIFVPTMIGAGMTLLGTLMNTVTINANEKILLLFVVF